MSCQKVNMAMRWISLLFVENYVHYWILLVGALRKVNKKKKLIDFIIKLNLINILLINEDITLKISIAFGKSFLIKSRFMQALCTP